MQLAFPVLLDGETAQNGTALASGEGISEFQVSLQHPGCRPLEIGISNEHQGCRNKVVVSAMAQIDGLQRGRGLGRPRRRAPRSGPSPRVRWLRSRPGVLGRAEVAGRRSDAADQRFTACGPAGRSLPVPACSEGCHEVPLIGPLFNELQCYTVPSRNATDSPVPAHFVLATYCPQAPSTMTERPYRLSARFVETIREPGTYGDGRGSGGLSLRVKRTARGHLAKSWGQRVVVKVQKNESTPLGASAVPGWGAKWRLLPLSKSAIIAAWRTALAERTGVEPVNGGLSTETHASDAATLPLSHLSYLRVTTRANSG